MSRSDVSDADKLCNSQGDRISVRASMFISRRLVFEFAILYFKMCPHIFSDASNQDLRVCVHLVAQSSPPLCDTWTVTHQAPLSWNSPGKNTEVGCHFLL